MKSRTIAALTALIWLATTSAQGSSISVYFAPDGSDCDANVPINTPVTWFIMAHLYGDAASNGITGAEFSQRGTPAGWFVTWTPNPSANIDIRPVGDIGMGANIAFPNCQTGSAGLVLLYTAFGFATTQVGPTCLWIDAHQVTPSNPGFDCPFVVLCDPVFTKLCVPGGTGTINASCYSSACTVDLEPAPWTQIKSLYR